VDTNIFSLIFGLVVVGFIAVIFELSNIKSEIKSLYVPEQDLLKELRVATGLLVSISQTLRKIEENTFH
jgi:hypothetical protein